MPARRNGNYQGNGLGNRQPEAHDRCKEIYRDLRNGSYVFSNRILCSSFDQQYWKL
ncbi:hypothetical protein GLAREA_07860 [Glarea lozoyensis ATCC 20868]|uniref:Uncharacterized protein n=1 Tax=Glarea lozoyensis (strain ATCC 20868 / MF5171) TaxID=1116229 RepID=S3DKZ4_GLAL2|nr:uncharacterized protein GLAREA_07860 [Glarea lozoyensis ATCC 20868]EPE32726.1 hypothetical protein GLAREA_07860 [Glarea lozoyensis ATCC 20868]